MSGSDRKAASRCSALRLRDSCAGTKFPGVRSLKDMLETVGCTGTGTDDWTRASVDVEEFWRVDDETRAIRCLDGGGTLAIVGLKRGRV